MFFRKSASNIKTKLKNIEKKMNILEEKMDTLILKVSEAKVFDEHTENLKSIAIKMGKCNCNYGNKSDTKQILNLLENTNTRLELNSKALIDIEELLGEFIILFRES